MLSNAKHLAFSGSYEAEILRLRLRMTSQYSLFAGEGTNSQAFVGLFGRLVRLE